MNYLGCALVVIDRVLVVFDGDGLVIDVDVAKME